MERYKTLNVPLSKENWELLNQLKGKRTWEEFIIDAALAEQKEGMSWRSYIMDTMYEYERKQN